MDQQNDLSPPWPTTIKLIVGVILFVLFALAIYVLRKVFTPIIFGAIIAYLLFPVAKTVSRITRLSHELATVIVYLVLLALLVPIGFLVAPVLVDQVTDLRDVLIRTLNYADSLGSETIEILPGVAIDGQAIVDEVTVALGSFIRATASRSISLLVGASKTLLLIIFTIFIAFYFTADAHKFIDWLQGIGPRSYRADVKILLSQINAIWGDFFRGQVVLAVVVTLILTALSFAIGLPQPLLMGLLGGLLEFLVSVGHTIWLIVALALALIEGSTYLPVSNIVFALIVVGTNLIFTKFDLNYLIPKIVGSRVRLHPVVVIIGIIVGATVAGVLGIALAAPTIATLRVIGRYIRAKMFDLDPFPELESAPVVAPKPGRAATPVTGSQREAQPVKSGTSADARTSR
jgi:predicted PurR-regulated permease PerM